MEKLNTKNLGSWGIHWFRRDLRIFGNTALRENWKKSEGKVLGIFCVDKKFLARSDISINRFAFFLNTIEKLQDEMRSQGGDLLVVDFSPKEAFKALLKYLEEKGSGLPQFISWNRDYEPFARARDKEMEEFFKKAGIETICKRDHLLFEPWEVLKDDQSSYQVYSPFSRKWFDLLKSTEGQARLQVYKKVTSYLTSTEKLFQLRWSDLWKGKPLFTDALREWIHDHKNQVSVLLPPAGFHEAVEALKNFKKRIESYKKDRDFPSIPGTSQLSIYLKNGSLTSAQVVRELGIGMQEWKGDSGETQYLKEIAWREFYYSILYHRPQVETSAFNRGFEAVGWKNDEKWFAHWCAGTTGFPIVDAGMRQLKQTGWMHNRVRMIVASFLTKDLLIDWRRGEKFFMNHLLDGDLAPNNGGWQWAASTGCDPQPYFRIFNPWLQGEKFDPEGVYIKTYIPELMKTDPKEIHDPDGIRMGYPRPIVSHAIQKHLALKLFEDAKKGIS